MSALCQFGSFSPFLARLLMRAQESPHWRALPVGTRKGRKGRITNRDFRSQETAAQNQKQMRKTLEMKTLRRKSPVLAVFRPLPPTPLGRCRPDAGLPSPTTLPGSDVPSGARCGRSLRFPSELCRFLAPPTTQPAIALQYHAATASILNTHFPPTCRQFA